MNPLQNVNQPMDNFSEGIRKLNALGESFSLRTKIKNIALAPFRACYEVWCGRWERNWGVHVAAEHMSQQEFSGNFFEKALQGTIAHLKRTNELLGGEGNKWSRKLEYSLQIEKQLAPLITNTSPISKRVEGDVRKLEVGDSLIIPSMVKKHATIMEIKRTGASSFSVTVHNTGMGILERHEQVSTDKNRKKIQTAYVLEEVPEEKLCNGTFFKTLFSKSVRGEKVESLYELLETLEGKKVATSYREQREYWGHGQIGGSCTASCLLSLLSSRMGREKLKIFKNSVRKETFLRMYKEVREGRSRSNEINATAEIAKKLLSSPRPGIKKGDDLALREALNYLGKAKSNTASRKMKDQRQILSESSVPLLSVENLLPSKDTGKSPLTEEQFNTSSSLFEMLSDLKKGGVYTDARHRHLKEMFIRIESKGMTLQPSEEAEFKQFATKLAAFVHAAPALTKDQMYICAAMMALTYQIYGNVFENEPIPEKLLTALQMALGNYQQISKGEETVSIDKVIDARIRQISLIQGKRAPSPQNSPLHKALKQWEDPLFQREGVIQNFLLTRPSRTDLYLFFKKTVGTPEESSAKTALERHLQSSTPIREKESYANVYKDYLLIGEEKGLEWYEAKIFADSCAKKYSEIDLYITQAGQAIGKSLAIDQKRTELINGFLQEYSSAFLERLLAARTDYHPDIEAISKRLYEPAQSRLLEKINNLFS